MKKAILIISTITLLIIIWKLTWPPSFKEQLQAETPKNLNVQTDANYKDKESLQGFLDTKDAGLFNNKFVIAKSCDELTAMCPECRSQWDNFIDEGINFGLEAALAGPYSQMTSRQRETLAINHDREGMYFHGTNLVWQGVVGVNYFYNEDIEPRPSNDSLKGREINLELVNTGIDYLYRSAIQGKYLAWNEIQNAYNMSLNKHYSKGIYKLADIKKLQANQLAVVKVVRTIFTDNPAALKVYYSGLRAPDDLKKWFPNLSEENISIEKQSIESMSDELADGYFKRWETDRLFLGEDVHPVIVSNDFVAFSKKAEQLCLDYR